MTRPITKKQQFWGHLGAKSFLEPCVLICLYANPKKLSDFGVQFGTQNWLLFGYFWDHVLDTFGALFDQFWGPFLGQFGAILGYLRPSWGRLEPSWGRLEAILMHFGAFLDHLGGVLGPRVF